MALESTRQRARRKLTELSGVRSVRRPVTPAGEADFDLYYVRSGPVSAHPLVVIPGGPGVASVSFYRAFRGRAAALGLDVIMVEHRGVGLSRRDDAGADLPPEALTVDQVVDDVAAVLDDAGVDRAVIYGTSYGTYIASGVGVRYPGRVAAMVLDSPLLSRHDIDAVRDALRGVLLDGADPETEQLAAKARKLVDDGVLTPAAGQLAAAIYGYGGAPLLDRQLSLLLRRRTLLWTGLMQVGKLVNRQAPYVNEVDLVERIAYRELDYAGVPDGLPLDPSPAMLESAFTATEFEAEPYDLVAEMPKFGWPAVVISGGRDLTTPPAVAERVAALIPGAVLVRMPTMGHSALDFRERAALAVAEAVSRGAIDGLGGLAPTLDSLPASPGMRLFLAAVSIAATVEAKLPVGLPAVFTS